MVYGIWISEDLAHDVVALAFTRWIRSAEHHIVQSQQLLPPATPAESFRLFAAEQSQIARVS